MDKAELTYSVKGIFTKCLDDYHFAQSFYISPYQRGYKWGARKGEPVWQLLDDINNSFKYKGSDRKKEYYLQYITLKPRKTHNDTFCLEVIDGQQRLTTLSILLATIKKLDARLASYSDGKIDYAVRTQFLKDWVYSNKIDSLLSFESWDSFIAANGTFDKQDVYFLFGAAKAIETFLTDIITLENLRDFYTYLCDDVKLIVNAVETHVNSEKVFANLNTNKVLLTEDDLIKALLLTRSGRQKSETGKPRSYREIMDWRSLMGRQWDEMQNWVETAGIKSVFFPKMENAMLGLLKLTGTTMQYNELAYADNKYPLFEFFQRSVQEETLDSKAILEKTILIFKILQEWNINIELYNALGYLFHCKNAISLISNQILLAQLIQNTLDNSSDRLRPIYKHILKHAIFKEDADAKDWFYGTDNELLQDLFLLLNVFFKATNRFDFNSYGDRSWSLEHIFPQNPRISKYKLNDKEILMLKEIVNKEEKWGDIEQLLTQEALPQEQMEQLDEKLKMDAPLLNSIGNMALLTREDNASISNGLFDKKRQIISEKINEGKYVPAHTYAVFSKLILPQTTDLKFWNRADIEEHTIHIVTELKRIKEKLTMQ